MGEAPARLLWVNGPPFVGKRTLAAAMRDRWGLVAFRAEEVGFELQAGLPGALDPGGLQDLGAWVWALWRLGARLARLYPPVVVMPATLYRPDVAGELVACLRHDGVDVVHVVLDADDAVLRGRVHGSGACLEAKRWALEHARPAVKGWRSSATRCASTPPGGPGATWVGSRRCWSSGGG